ncbi:MAG: hypothetical protein H6Q90_3683 [Deltaproteobacteria bacterium]|nr:hypothetical protein [Deltaproteobacteria bacterium]
MKIKQTRYMLFAVAIANGTVATAAAEPSVPVQAPRTLATGQPACGNVMYKTPEHPACPTLRTIVTVIEQARELGQDLPFVRSPARAARSSLTVALKDRPRP